MAGSDVRPADQPEALGRLQPREAVAQTIACLDFLYVCDKVTILG